MGFKRLPDNFQYSVQFVQHLIVPESDDPKSCLPKCPITRFVSCRFIVLSTINLDNKLSFKANEIQNEIAKRMLPPELVTIDLSTTQPFP